MMHVMLALVLASNSFGAFAGTGRNGGSGGGQGGGVVRPSSVGWFGDSITAGACSPQSPPVLLDALLPGGSTGGYTVSNEGVSGETTHQIYTRVVSSSSGVGASTACLGEPCGHYIVQGGVNTLKSAAYNASTASAVAEIALNGTGTCSVGASDSCGTLDSVDYLHVTYPNARLFVIGVLPYGGCDVATCPSKVDPGERAAAYNAALLTACASRPWLNCRLPYDDFEDPENADNLYPDYACADGIHLITAGSERLADKVYTGVSW